MSRAGGRGARRLSKSGRLPSAALPGSSTASTPDEGQGISVCVRMRPTADGSPACYESFTHEGQEFIRDPASGGDRGFPFNKVFGPSNTNTEIFDAIGRRSVEQSVDGYAGRSGGAVFVEPPA